MSYLPIQTMLMDQQGSASPTTLTTSEVSIVSVPLPGGLIKTNGRATLFYAGNITTTGLTLPTLAFRAKYDTASLTITSALVLLTSLTQGKFFITASLHGAGTTSSQYLFAELRDQITALAGTNNLYNPHAAGAAISVASTSTKNLSITAQLSAALGTVTLNQELYRVELQPGV